jgi:hypothetical protein
VPVASQTRIKKKGTQQSRCLPSPEDGNRASFQNVVFFSNYLESGRWTKSVTPVILCVIHHRQNPIESRVLDLPRTCR